MNTLPAAPGDILAVWTGNGPEQNVIRVAEALVGKPAFVPRPDYAAVAAALGMPLGSVSPTAAGPLDDADLGILDGVREMFEAADATPAGLPGRIRFSLALRDLDVEMARLAAEEDSPVLAVRGVEQSRLITFDSDSLTIMIRIDANADGTARVDGWLAPPQHREIEMKTSAESLHVASDEQGRFAFAAVPREARRRGLLEGNAGRPAVGSRYARAGLRQLGLGFTAALLYIGTATVISSVARVADAAAAGMMTGYHRLLAAGANPAEAALGEPFSPFVCFGGGSPLR
jgi:hypothetical protein